MNKKWCQNHFTCFGCDLDFTTSKAPYFEWDLKPLCRNCYDQLPSSVRKCVEKYDQIDKKVKKKREEEEKKAQKKNNK